MKQLILFIACIGLLSGCRENGSKIASFYDSVKVAATPALDTVRRKAQLSINKIDYEVHERDQKAYNGATWQWWDVVIKSVNPSKDDYKGYCKYIISDIVRNKKAEINGLSIVIYDDEKAYLIDEKEKAPEPEINQGDTRAIVMHRLKVKQAKWKSDMKYADSHRIAMYTGIMPEQVGGDGASHMLYFYDGADKGYKYKGDEAYWP